MHKNNTIWLDCDGVLLGYLGGFLKYHELEVTPDEIDTYDLSVLFASKQDMKEAIKEFEQSREYGLLQPLALITSLEQLKNMGYSLRVLTHVNSLTGRISRIRNLTNAYGALFDGIHFVSDGESKLTYIEENRSSGDNYMIDDSPHVLEDFQENCPRGVGITSVTILYDYNREFRDKYSFGNYGYASVDAMVNDFLEEAINEQ